MHRAPPPLTPPDSDLVESMLSPDAFSHPVTDVELIETHISWLILTDDFAYKIKKPIVLDFLDFGDLEKRRFYCEEEIRLNKPWAPDIYIDVVPVTRDNGQARFDGAGEPIEYAVRMRRFDDGLRLDRQLEQGLLLIADMKELASSIAARHIDAPLVEHDRRAIVIALTKQFMVDNFLALDGFIDDATLDALKDWTDAELLGTESLLAQRFDDGFVRDCHGDLHLGNLVRLPTGIATFDCIEFNADLRHIDVMCDIAFLFMDLVARKKKDLAAHFLNRYLEVTGDYGGVSVLRLFFVYRCLVRAKVAVIRSQERENADARKADLDEARAYCDMAMRESAARAPILMIMHGLSGSGKTFVSGQLMAAIPAVRVRSDIERKRIFGLGERASSHSEVGGGIYSARASRDVYKRLFDTARTILTSGHSVILDAAFLAAAERAGALAVAAECRCPAVIVEVTASDDVMRERLLRRSREKQDASEAGLDILDHQLATREGLSDDERQRTVVCENMQESGTVTIVERIRVLAADQS